MTRRKPSAFELSLLLGFHAVMSGAFLVAYLTGDEDTYGMHVVAGYAVLAALLVRLAAALVAPANSPLRLPGPRLGEAARYLGRLLSGDPAARRERSPLYAWVAALLLIGTGSAALSGAITDFVPRLDDVHEALGELSLYIAICHIAIVLLLRAVKPRGPAALPQAAKAGVR